MYEDTENDMVRERRGDETSSEKQNAAGQCAVRCINKIRENLKVKENKFGWTTTKTNMFK